MQYCAKGNLTKVVWNQKQVWQPTPVEELLQFLQDALKRKSAKTVPHFPRENCHKLKGCFLTVYLTVIVQFSTVQLHSINFFFLHFKNVKNFSIFGNIWITVLFYLHNAVAFHTNSTTTYMNYWTKCYYLVIQYFKDLYLFFYACSCFLN